MTEGQIRAIVRDEIALAEEMKERGAIIIRKQHAMAQRLHEYRREHPDATASDIAAKTVEIEAEAVAAFGF